MRLRPPVWVLPFALSAVASLPLARVAAVDGGASDSTENARRSQVVAKGEGFTITLGMLEDQINKQPPALRARFAGPEERKNLLTSLVRLELLAAEAERRGLGDGVAVRQTMKDGAVQTMLRSEIDEKVTSDSISKQDIAAYYEAHPADFHHPAQRRASHIALGSEADARALLPEAQKADLHAFAELAKKRSVDGETKLRGGDLGFFPLEQGREPGPRKVPEALRKAVFGLKAVGDTAEAPVAVEAQFSIVRFTGERPERHVTEVEAESSIRSKLWRERRQQAVNTLIEGLRAKEKPKVYVERVDWVKFDDMDKRPPGFAPDPLPPGMRPMRTKGPKPSAPPSSKGP